MFHLGKEPFILVTQARLRITLYPPVMKSIPSSLGTIPGCVYFCFCNTASKKCTRLFYLVSLFMSPPPVLDGESKVQKLIFFVSALMIAWEPFKRNLSHVITLLTKVE